MPLSTDNQDFTPNEEARKEKPLVHDVGSTNDPTSKAATSTSTEDENNFDSDNQKGKKVDGDPSEESDQPAKLNQD